MASLTQLIKDHKDEIRNGVAWVAIYKDGRSWEAEAFYPEDGNYVNGYVFDGHDYARMKEIAGIDGKALCINGYYSGGLEDFSLKELEDKIFDLYISRYQQLFHFVEDFVYPPESVKENQGSVEELIVAASERSEGVGNGVTPRYDVEFEKE